MLGIVITKPKTKKQRVISLNVHPVAIKSTLYFIIGVFFPETLPTVCRYHSKLAVRTQGVGFLPLFPVSASYLLT